MSQTGLRPETEATLLLCASFGSARREEVASPLNVRELNEFLAVLERLAIPLSEVLRPERKEQLESDLEGRAMLDGRIGSLLGRGTSMALAVERWHTQGIRVLDRTDLDYPERFRDRLGKGAPPLLYCSGDTALLHGEEPRIAVVGSRDIDDAARQFATDVGNRAAEIDTLIVSGGAKGVDRASVEGALAAGGRAINVLPGDLERFATLRTFRDAIADGQLLACSPYHPRAKFSAGNAMGRNRLIYCLADAGVVVESSEGTGGTWSGAMETIKHGWVPVYVRRTETPAPGNLALIERGARPLSESIVDSAEAFREWVSLARSDHETTDDAEDGTRQLDLFGTG
jgi:predicted Rossmann fold nucleotide-binding protein DprA/Smf involved in DNA uptake